MAAMNFDFDPIYSTAAYRNIAKKSQSKPAEDPIAEESSKEPTKVRYRKEVLVGDWYEKRAKYVPPPDDWITVYDIFYDCKINAEFKKTKRAYVDIKNKSEQGLGSEFLIEYPGDAFRRNFTTTNDLYYRIIPQGLCGPKLRKYSSRKDLWLPQPDLAQNYGNLTKFGLIEQVECERYMEETPSPRKSITKTQIVEKDLTDFKTEKRFPNPIGKFNEPLLCHLDIDPEKPFRPHLIKVRT